MSEVPTYFSRQRRHAHIPPSVSPQFSIRSILHAFRSSLGVFGRQRTLSIPPYPTLPYDTRPDLYVPDVGRGDEERVF